MDAEDLIAYGVDASCSVARLPDVVAHPRTHDEVVRLVEAAAAAHVPLVPRGAGTGLSGGSLAAQGGLVIVFDRMNHLIRLDSGDLVAVVEPGVLNWQLQKAASEASLFYPPDPSSARVCTLGGNVAENAGGPRAVKYGVTADYLVGLQCVLSSGKSMRIGGAFRRNATGYDLLHLMAGSEGTLAIVTEVTLRLLPKPPHRRAVTFTFESILTAGDAVVALGACGVTPSAIEIMDRTAIECAREFIPGILTGEGAAQLLIEVDGGSEETLVQIEKIKDVCKSAGGNMVSLAANEEEVNVLWDVRRSVSASLGRMGRKKIGEDISVPRSKVPEIMSRIEEIAEQNGVTIAVFGHAGDGNLHPNILADEGNAEEMQRVEAAIAEIFQATVELGGTLSGEHGIGTAKAPFLGLALSREASTLMEGIKDVFDPLGIMNPGKIFVGFSQTV